MKKPSNKTLDKIDMSSILSNIPETDTNLKYIDMPSGKEHYRLLVWFGKQVKGRILDLGTFRGHSALCLGKFGEYVHTLDVENNISVKKMPQHIHFDLSDIGHKWVNNGYDLILLDTLHDGIYEREVLDYLRSIKWKGILVMDDIILFPELAKLWAEIPERKEDWTDVGHHSGTGVVYFE